MSSACPQAAKSLFAESKRRLSDRVAVNVNNCASVARQIVRGKSKFISIFRDQTLHLCSGSKSHDILIQAAKGLAQQDATLENCASNINKIQLIQKQLGYQHEAVKEGAEKLSDIREQVDSMERWKLFQMFNGSTESPHSDW